MKFVSFVVALLIGVIFAGCVNEDSQTVDARPLPDGWSRVQVRNGFVARDSEYALDGFTIDLPPGWTAGESWPFGGPSGWVAGSERGENDYPTILNFGIGSEISDRVIGFAERPEYEITRPVINGQAGMMYLTSTTTMNEIGIYFEHIPGAPQGIDAPPLWVSGRNRETEDMDLIAEVLTSIRYKALERLPELPEPKVKRGDDWTTYIAGPNSPRFTVDLPPGWEKIDVGSYDSFAGNFVGDGIRLGFDYGGMSGLPWEPSLVATNPKHYQPHLLWEEVLDDNKVWLVKPVSSEPHEDRQLGALATASGGMDFSTKQVAFFTSGLDGEQQELALAILRTVVVMD